MRGKARHLAEGGGARSWRIPMGTVRVPDAGMTHASPTQTPVSSKTPPAAEGRKHVHALLKEFDTVMLITFEDASAPAGTTPAASRIHARPMNVAQLDPDSTLWFVTAIDSPKIAEAESPPIGHVVAQSARKFVSLAGTFTVTRDRAKMKQVWSKMNDVWFPEGIDDPRACLLGFHPTEAELWDVLGGTGIKFLLESVAALVTGTAKDQSTSDRDQHDKVAMRGPQS